MKSNDSERIKILWIDDESDEFIENAFYDAGIDATIFTTTEKALNEYKTHRGTFQAIILDLRGEDGTTIEFSKAVKEFEKYLKEDLIPLYVLTNYLQSDQPYKEARGVISAFGLKEDNIYHKGSQVTFLIADLKKVVLEGDRFKIYKKYESAFEAFEKDILDKDYQESLFKIVECISGKSDDYIGLFNDMRQIYEMILHRFVDVKFSAEYFYGLNDKKQPSFSNSAKETRRNVIDYLSGNKIHVGFKGQRLKTEIQIKSGRVLSLFMMDIIERLYNVLSDVFQISPTPLSSLLK